jgi:zinc transporter
MSTTLETAPDGEIAGFEPRTIPGLVHGYCMQADGRVEELAPDFQFDAAMVRGQSWYWLHLNLADARTAGWLKTLAELPVNAQAFVRAHHDHQQLNASPGCIFGAIADLTIDLEQSLDRTGFLNFAFTDRLVVTGRRQRLQAVGRLRDAIRGGRRLANPAALADALVNYVADGIDEFVERLVADTDRIEDLVLAEAFADERRPLGSLRRTGVRLHRQLTGLRSLLHRFEHSGRNDLNEALRLSVGQFAQRLDDLDHEVVAMQERARLLQEEIAAQLAEENNRLLRTISIVTAVFLPPALAFGFFGMNTHDLPFVETPLGTVWAAAVAIGGSALALWWLRRRRGTR